MALRPSVTGVSGTAPPPDAPVQSVTGADTPTDVQFGNLNQDTLAALGDRLDPSAIGQTASQMARSNERELQPLAAVPADAPAVVKTAVVAAPNVVAANVPAVGMASAPHSHALAGQPAPTKGTLAAPAPPQLMDAAARSYQTSAPSRRLRPSPTMPLAHKPAVPVVAAADKISGTASVQPGVAAHVAAAAPGVKPAGAPPDQSRPNQASRGGAAAHEKFQPAASDSDSPSRGIPRAIADPGKQITGGFGNQVDAQYFPLDGSELRSTIWLLMDELAARLQNDIRFTMAITYPRVAVKVQIVVEGYSLDQPMVVEKIMPPHLKTPIEIAEQRADEICFVVKTERREFNQAGDPINPPNAIRTEIGAIIPHKQSFGEGANRVIADISS